jgi:hypothetical protein
VREGQVTKAREGSLFHIALERKTHIKNEVMRRLN